LKYSSQQTSSRHVEPTKRGSWRNPRAKNRTKETLKDKAQTSRSKRRRKYAKRRPSICRIIEWWGTARLWKTYSCKGRGEKGFPRDGLKATASVTGGLSELTKNSSTTFKTFFDKPIYSGRQ
jgi:hypothetical protein